MVKADGREVAQIGVWRFDGPMGRIGPQLLTPGENVQSQPVDDARLRIGEVELGSYSALEATVQLVGAQRHFEAAMQAIQTYRRLDDKANEIGHIK
jgi:flagellar basal-body rod protein FlgF